MSTEALGRRRFLRGLYGVSVALPALDSLCPRTARAATTPTKGFAVFVRSANGVAQANGAEPERFWPVPTPGSMTADSLRTQSAHPPANALTTYPPNLHVTHSLTPPL